MGIKGVNQNLISVGSDNTIFSPEINKSYAESSSASPAVMHPTPDMRESSGHNRIGRSLFVGAIGTVVGACVGVGLTLLAWSGIRSAFDSGVGIEGEFTGMGSGNGTVNGQVNGEGNVTGEIDNIRLGWLDLPVDGGIGGVGSGTIEGGGIAEGEVIVDNIDAGISGEAGVEMPGPPWQVLITAAAIFAAVIGFAFYVVERLHHLISSQSDMRSDNKEQLVNVPDPDAFPSPDLEIQIEDLRIQNEILQSQNSEILEILRGLDVDKSETKRSHRSHKRSNHKNSHPVTASKKKT